MGVRNANLSEKPGLLVIAIQSVTRNMSAKFKTFAILTGLLSIGSSFTFGAGNADRDHRQPVYKFNLTLHEDRNVEIDDIRGIDFEKIGIKTQEEFVRFLESFRESIRRAFEGRKARERIKHTVTLNGVQIKITYIKGPSAPKFEITLLESRSVEIGDIRGVNFKKFGFQTEEEFIGFLESVRLSCRTIFESRRPGERITHAVSIGGISPVQITYIK